MKTIEDTAAQESGLAAELKDDPVLLAFYQRKLLIRNWPGSRTATEKRYCQLIYHAKHCAADGGDPTGYPDLPLPYEDTDAPTGEHVK